MESERWTWHEDQTRLLLRNASTPSQGSTYGLAIGGKETCETDHNRTFAASVWLSQLRVFTLYQEQEKKYLQLKVIGYIFFQFCYRNKRNTSTPTCPEMAWRLAERKHEKPIIKHLIGSAALV